MTGLIRDILGIFYDLPKNLGRHKAFGNLQKPYEYLRVSMGLTISRKTA